METVKRKSGLRYREKIYINGKPIVGPFFKTKTLARQWKRRAESDRDRQRALGVDHYQKKSFSDFAELWLAKKADRERKTVEGYSSVLKKYLIPFLGDLNLNEIKLSHGEELKLRLVKESSISRTRINFVLKVLKMVLFDAEKNCFIYKTPFAALELLRVQQKSKTYWLKFEVNQFLSASKQDHFYPLYCFMLNTGVRPCEARGLLWDKVDLDSRFVEISRKHDRHGLKEVTKSKVSRKIPLNRVLVQILSELKSSSSSDYVFTQPNGSPFGMHHGDRIFPKAVKRAKVRKIKFKHLRSTYACNFVMSGGDIFSLQKILGHHSVQITENSYADLHQDFLQKEAQIIQFKAQDSPYIALAIKDIVESVENT